MGQSKFSLQADVTVDGFPLSRELQPVLEQVIVDDDLHLPDTFVLVFRDVERRVLSQAGLEIGKRVSISGTPLGEQIPQLLISGEVTAIGGEYDANGSKAIVRGYDPSHRLHRGRRTDTYKDVKDSDIARTLAAGAGLEIGEIEDTGPAHEHVSQVNTSDWDFLKGRAREIGFEISVLDGKFNLRKPRPATDAPAEGDYTARNPLQLVFDSEKLLEFRPRITSAEQVKEVQVRGWDPAEKRAVIGSASAAETTSAVLSSATPGKLAAKFGDPTFVVVDRPMSTQAGVDAAASAIAEQIGSAFVEAELVMRGDPKLKAGAAVSISKVSEDFVGLYTLTKSRHVFDKDGYRTMGTVSGRQERSILGLASMGGTNGSGAGAARSKIYGVVVALVDDNDDPEGLGRVRLRFPWLSDNFVSDWARTAQLSAGIDRQDQPQGSGSVFIPEVDDEVLVAFEHGDPQRPIVIGSLYNGQAKPRLDGALFIHGRVDRREFSSRERHRITFNDGGHEDGIVLETAEGKVSIQMTQDNKFLVIYAGGQITIGAPDGVDIVANSGPVRVSGVDVTIDAQASLSLSGATVKIDSQGPLTVTGTPIKLN